MAAVEKRYGRGRWILRGVDLEIRPGEVTAVCGSNGSGKSTLLRMLVGLTLPTSGSISGRPEVVGYVPDRFPPNERLSALSYLTHMGRIRGLNTDVAAVRADRLVERLALVSGHREALWTLSRGNAQKVALAQALLVRPELLVLDEPWSGLDASAHGVLAEIIDEVADVGGAVVFTDHRVAVVDACATRVCTLAEGRVQGQGPTTQGKSTGPMVEVVLHRPVGSAEQHEVDWEAIDGVRAVVPAGEQVTVRVARDQCDALLLAVLRWGWSVWRVDQGGDV